MLDDKYIVFRRPPEGEPMDPNPIPDAVVIRTQDIFAGAALHAYSSSIQTVIELLEEMGEPQNRMHGTPLSTEQLVRLHEVRDYFFERALEADDVSSKKVPD